MKRIINPPPGPKTVSKNTSQKEVDEFWHRRFNITSFLFDKQLAFVDDPAPFKVAVCSRRSGKTVACAAHLIHTAINNPDSTCLYITLSGTSGKRIVWKEFKKIIRNFGLPAKANEIELSLTFQNGATVYVIGAKDANEIEKIRGIPIKLCYIDECQSFRHSIIKDLIDDIIGPALMDYAGTLMLIGTPGPVPTGYFYECATSSVWSKHGWTFWDNPHIPLTSKMTHQEVFDREMRRRGFGAEALEVPSVKREWFGKWELDKDSLLVRYNADLNHFQELPLYPKGYSYILGIDVGFKDADALAVLAWSDASPTTYLIEELVTPKQGLTELVQQIQGLEAKYKSKGGISKMVMDMGGLGLKIGEEMIRRYQIPVEAADKTRKMENIELMNDALRTGRLKAKSASRFAQDSYLVEIDRDKSTPDRIKVSDKYHSDIVDAVLYAFKCSPAYAWSPEAPPKPKWGTIEWHQTQHEEMFQRELDEALARQEHMREYGEES